MIREGRTLGRSIELWAQVVVVGSGSGGAIIARELAEEGYDVLILEEGPHVTPEEYGAWRPTKVMRSLYRSGGSTAALGLGGSPTVGIMMGSCVGGGSVLTGGVCFRTPRKVHEAWVETLGISGLGADAMAPCYERVEEMMHIMRVPDMMRSRSTIAFGKGIAALGAPLQAMRRNTLGCTGQAKCNYGCPQQSKISVDLSYLPRARQCGATIFSDMRVDRVLTDQGKAVGVEGRVLGPDRAPTRHTFKIHAEHVVLAAGALHTPLLMMASGLGKRSGVLGRNLSIHPGFGVQALFDQPIKIWQGAMQSAFAHHPQDDRLIYLSVAAPPSLLGGFFGGAGAEYISDVRDGLQHLAMFGAMVHDDSSGRVWPGLGREPVVTYAMSRRDKKLFRDGVKFAMRAFLEAGAHTVFNPFVGFDPVHSVDALERVDFDAISMERAQSLSYHPLGTCQMGTDPARSVVDPKGQCHDLENLWIADGSVLPTSVGVNAQLPIMGMTTRMAFEMIAAIKRPRPRVFAV